MSLADRGLCILCQFCSHHVRLIIFHHDQMAVYATVSSLHNLFCPLLDHIFPNYCMFNNVSTTIQVLFKHKGLIFTIHAFLQKEMFVCLVFHFSISLTICFSMISSLASSDCTSCLKSSGIIQWLIFIMPPYCLRFICSCFMLAGIC